MSSVAPIIGSAIGARPIYQKNSVIGINFKLSQFFPRFLFFGQLWLLRLQGDFYFSTPADVTLQKVVKLLVLKLLVVAPSRDTLGLQLF